MVRQFVLGAVVMVSVLGLAGQTQAEKRKAVCAVAAQMHGTKKFATLKCYKDSQPGDYVIRSTIWEAKDRAGYRKLAQYAGHRFSCNLIDAGDTRDGGMQITHYKIENCR